MTSPGSVESTRISCDEPDESHAFTNNKLKISSNDHSKTDDLNEILNNVYIENNRLTFLDQHDDYCLPNLDEADANADPDEQETERLLDNIEQMLKSMQDNHANNADMTVTSVPCAQNLNEIVMPNAEPAKKRSTNRVNTINESANLSLNKTNTIKLEPVESNNNNNNKQHQQAQSGVTSSFKKISPKVSCEANSTPPPNKLVLPSASANVTPTTTIPTIVATSALPNTIILHSNVDPKTSQAKTAKMPLMSKNNDKKQQQILVTPAQHKLQPQLTVLTAIPAVACQAPALPLIIATTNDASSINMQNLIPNTIILDNGANAAKDSPKAKRIKQDKSDVIIIEKSPVTSTSPNNTRPATNQSPTAKPAFANNNQNSSHIDVKLNF